MGYVLKIITIKGMRSELGLGEGHGRGRGAIYLQNDHVHAGLCLVHEAMQAPVRFACHD